MIPQYYFYRQTTDNGGAPCCGSGLWTLAICKPRIRMGAHEGDFVVGFAGDGIAANNGVIHVARVTKVVPGCMYYSPRGEFRGRADCIYEWDGQDYQWTANRFHSASDMEGDLGAAPKRERAVVLLSEQFKYFGAKPLRVDWTRFPRLRARLSALRQGERVHHDPEVATDLITLVEEALHTPGPAVLNAPSHGVGTKCNADDGEEEGRCKPR